MLTAKCFPSNGFRRCRVHTNPEGLERSQCREANPEGPPRHLDVSRRKLSPHCLETIFGSQLPSPKSSPELPPKLSLAHKRHIFPLSKLPLQWGTLRDNWETNIVSRQFCPATSRCFFWLARQQMPRDNACRSVAAQLPSSRDYIWKRKQSPLLWGRGNLGGILRGNLGEGSCESKTAARQRGVKFCRETLRCLLGPSGKGVVRQHAF